MTSANPWITAREIADCLLAIVAFIPANLCTGYLAAWFTNLHNFRQRTFIERLFWSIPLSLAISTIASVLIGRFLSGRRLMVLRSLRSDLACYILRGTAPVSPLRRQVGRRLASARRVGAGVGDCLGRGGDPVVG